MAKEEEGKNHSFIYISSVGFFFTSLLILVPFPFHFFHFFGIISSRRLFIPQCFDGRPPIEEQDSSHPSKGKTFTFIKVDQTFLPREPFGLVLIVIQ
jgi:hypothetical protein